MFGETLTEEERERRKADPFASLEGKVDQGEKVKSQNWWVEKLKEDRDQYWEDPWMANRRLRKTFREERKVLEEKDRDREEIADRLGLAIEVLDEIHEDGQRAALVSFGEPEEATERKVIQSAARPLFDSSPASSHLKIIGSKGEDRKTKAETKAEMSKILLQQSLKGNTRVVVDPFLRNPAEPNTSSSIATVLAGIKRKRAAPHARRPRDLEMAEPSVESVSAKSRSQEVSAGPSAGPLVGYDSDED
jgi:coiled-coil domain-containing protein 130